MAAGWPEERDVGLCRCESFPKSKPWKSYIYIYLYTQDRYNHKVILAMALLVQVVFEGGDSPPHVGTVLSIAGFGELAKCEKEAPRHVSSLFSGSKAQTQ